MDLVLSKRSGFEVRTQKHTSRAELLSDVSDVNDICGILTVDSNFDS